MSINCGSLEKMIMTLRCIEGCMPSAANRISYRRQILAKCYIRGALRQLQELMEMKKRE